MQYHPTVLLKVESFARRVGRQQQHCLWFGEAFDLVAALLTRHRTGQRYDAVRVPRARERFEQIAVRIAEFGENDGFFGATGRAAVVERS